MKRKEMIAQIADNVLINFISNMSLRERMLVADCVLSECEKYGMSPPVYKHMPHPFNDVYYTMSWEPENE